MFSNQPEQVPHFQRNVTVVNKEGLHARPALKVAELAKSFESTSFVTNGDMRVPATSCMELLLLEAVCGTELTVTAEGSDAKQAVDSLVALVANGFEDR